jgi:hypothetical protein
MIIAFKAGDMIVEDNDQDDSSVEP